MRVCYLTAALVALGTLVAAVPAAAQKAKGQPYFDVLDELVDGQTSTRAKAQDVAPLPPGSGAYDEAIVPPPGMYYGANGYDSCGPEACPCGDGCDSGCGSSCGSMWTVRFGIINLERDGNSDVPLVTDGVGGATLASTSDLDLDDDSGYEFSVIHDDGCGGWEARYFAVEDWASSATVAGAGMVSPLDPLDTPFTSATGSYFSELRGLELNRRWKKSDNWTWLAGLRWVELDEQLLMTTNAGAFASASSATQNDLFGGQIGAEGVLWASDCRPWWIEGWVKAGLYANEAEHEYSVAGGAPVRAESSHLAFLGEVGIRGVYEVTGGLGIYGGWQAMWLDGVALAPNQLDLVAAGGQGVRFNGDPFYHGFNVGVQYVR